MSTPSPTHWENPAVPPPLAPGEIHLWALRLREAPCDPAWLDADERRRLAAIPDPDLARTFCRSRCLLRQYLAAYLGRTPDGVRIVIDPGGKPRLAGGGPRFNLSHAGPWLLLAVAADRPVGVDVEIPRPLRRARAMAQRLFDADTRAALRAADDFDTAFFEAWTRHEARQKCLGRGLFGERARPGECATLGLSLDDGARVSLAWADARPTPRIRLFTAQPTLTPSL